MIEDHRRDHYDEKLDHNRNISTSVVKRSCVEVIIPKKELYQTDPIKGCFPLNMV